MRVCFVAPRAWPAPGGMESYLHHLAGALAQRHEVSILAQSLDSGPRGRLSDSLAPPPTFEPFADGEVDVAPLRLPLRRRVLLSPLAATVVPGLRRYAYTRVRIPATGLFAAVAGVEIARLAAGADLLHAWGGGMLAAATVRAARRLGVPVVITPFAHRGQWGDDVASGRTYRATDRVLALLGADADLYRGLGVPGDRIEPVGVCSPGVLAAGGEAIRRRHGIEGPLVLFLGVRRAYKGFELARAAATLLPEATFVFAGPGAPVQAAGAARMVDAGPVDDEERAAWLDAADVLCLPSEGEIFPVTFLEAWSAGTTVVGSDIPPLRELVERSGGGLVAPRTAAALAAALGSLIADPERRRTMAEAGRRFWLAGHTPAAVAERHEALYARLLVSEAVCAA